ncbi:UvrD/REP helicase N-terminal domain-containing protein [Pseudomonas guineae]|uniref:UvrD/REP helicase N-terminal domain-containing protein n=1 Tax=Pseudomonas guineae TaxID=425504 RepID=A0A1I3JWK7_9PSED|nr:DEAD/DEAH box helicase [Pseudomonas guineae]SFI64603.1 UvrD/REP helicase N-terminal domain-containing protein [Pseudomonas guineae]
MPSVVQRYTRRLAAALARYFPHTTAYLRAEREAHALPKQPGARTKKSPATAKPKTANAKQAAKPRRASTSARAQGIYGPAMLAVDAKQSQNMREQVARTVTAGVLSAPSDEQWAMILSDHPLTRIFAGAGSGKSTTLVLRVVFMLCHLGIKPEQLTVISFTNASCAELREQLLKVLGLFNYPFDAVQASQTVRTFHSAMGGMAKSLLDNPRWFEQLDDRQAAKRELDNPLMAGRLRPAQQRLLKQAYQQCYAEQPVFREQVHSLLQLPMPIPSDEAKRQPKAPLDAFKLQGEFSAMPLYEAFYAQAGFIESIGIDLATLQPQALSGPEQVRSFSTALVLFWPYFERALQEQGLMTFNAAFQQLTARLNTGAQGVAAQVLAPFSHLLIDEFQDISPQIVQWLQAVQRAQAERGSSVSLMAIGDDWQSIYGWRGSSPELFIDFDQHFPGKGRAKHSAVLTLANNYRSIEPIIRDAEALLDGVRHKQAKISQAIKAIQPGDHGVRLIQRFDSKARLPELLKQIQEQCAHAAQRNSPERNAVLLLSRRNEPLQAITAQLDKKLPFKAYTIHRAKGLQAEVAIILDDCIAPAPHPLRNALYAYSGFFNNSYDQAMQDESLRLAYVAVTRGVSRVFWYCQKTQGATQVLAGRGRF